MLVNRRSAKIGDRRPSSPSIEPVESTWNPTATPRLDVHAMMIVELSKG